MKHLKILKFGDGGSTELECVASINVICEFNILHLLWD